jgi:hypothetical protein
MKNGAWLLAVVALAGCFKVPVQAARVVDVARYTQRYVAADGTSYEVIRRLVGPGNTRLLCGPDEHCDPTEVTGPIWSAFVVSKLSVDGQFVITITPDAGDPEERVVVEGFGQYLLSRPALDDVRRPTGEREPVMQANFTMGGTASYDIAEIERLGYIVVPIVQEVWPIGGRAVATYPHRAGEQTRGQAYGGTGFVHTTEFVVVVHVVVERKLGNALFAVKYNDEHELAFLDGPAAGVFGCAKIAGPRDIWRKPIDVRDLGYVKKDTPVASSEPESRAPRWTSAASPCVHSQ